jgi:hypothetical protein
MDVWGKDDSAEVGNKKKQHFEKSEWQKYF